MLNQKLGRACVVIPFVAAVEDDDALVPARYRYTHHADVVRLDALIEHGGLYADIDTVFLRPLPDEWWDVPFAIASEGPVPDASGVERDSLCNALMVARPGADFARRWRAEIGARLGAAIGRSVRVRSRG